MIVGISIINTNPIIANSTIFTFYCQFAERVKCHHGFKRSVCAMTNTNYTCHIIIYGDIENGVRSPRRKSHSFSALGVGPRCPVTSARHGRPVYRRHWHTRPSSMCRSMTCFQASSRRRSRPSKGEPSSCPEGWTLRQICRKHRSSKRPWPRSVPKMSVSPPQNMK